MGLQSKQVDTSHFHKPIVPPQPMSQSNSSLKYELLKHKTHPAQTKLAEDVMGVWYT